VLAVSGPGGTGGPVQEGHPPCSVSGPGGTGGPGYREGILRGQCPPLGGYRRAILRGSVSALGVQGGQGGHPPWSSVGPWGYRRAILRGPVSGPGVQEARVQGGPSSVVQCPAPGVQEARVQEGHPPWSSVRPRDTGGHPPWSVSGPGGQEGHPRGPVSARGIQGGLGTEAILVVSVGPGIQEGISPWSVSAWGTRGAGYRGPSPWSVSGSGVQRAGTGGPSSVVSVRPGDRRAILRGQCPPRGYRRAISVVVSGPGIQEGHPPWSSVRPRGYKRARVQEGHPPWSVSGPGDTGGPSSVVNVRPRVSGPGGTGGQGAGGPSSVVSVRPGGQEGHPPWSVSALGYRRAILRGPVSALGIQGRPGYRRAILRGPVSARGHREAILRVQCPAPGDTGGPSLWSSVCPGGTGGHPPWSVSGPGGYRRAISRGPVSALGYKRARVQEGHPPWSVSALGQGGHPPWSVSAPGVQEARVQEGHPPWSVSALGYRRAILRGQCAPRRYKRARVRASPWSVSLGIQGPSLWSVSLWGYRRARVQEAILRGQCPAPGYRRAILRGPVSGPGVQEGQGYGRAILRGPVSGPGTGYRRAISVCLPGDTGGQGTEASVVSVSRDRRASSWSVSGLGYRRGILRGQCPARYREGHPPWSVSGPGVQEGQGTEAILRGQCPAPGYRRPGYRRAILRGQCPAPGIQEGHPPWSSFGPGYKRARVREAIRGQCRPGGGGPGYRRAIRGQFGPGYRRPGYRRPSSVVQCPAPGVQEARGRVARREGEGLCGQCLRGTGGPGYRRAILRGPVSGPGDTGGQGTGGPSSVVSVRPWGYRRPSSVVSVRPRGYKMARVQEGHPPWSVSARDQGGPFRWWRDTGGPSSVVQCPAPGIQEGHPPWSSVRPGVQEGQGTGGHPPWSSVRPRDTGGHPPWSSVRPWDRRPGYRRAILRGPVSGSGDTGGPGTGGPSSVVQCPALGYRRAILHGPVSGSGDTGGQGTGGPSPWSVSGPGVQGHLRGSVSPGIRRAILRGPVSGSGGYRRARVQGGHLRGPVSGPGIQEGHPPWSVSGPGVQEGQVTGGPSSVVSVRPGDTGGPSSVVSVGPGTRGPGYREGHLSVVQCPAPGVQEGQGTGGPSLWSVSAPGIQEGYLVEARLQEGYLCGQCLPRGYRRAILRGQCLPGVQEARYRRAILRGPVSGPGYRRARVQEGHPPWSVSGPGGTGGHPPWSVSAPGYRRAILRGQCLLLGVQEGQVQEGHPPWSVSALGTGGHPPWSSVRSGVQGGQGTGGHPPWSSVRLGTAGGPSPWFSVCSGGKRLGTGGPSSVVSVRPGVQEGQAWEAILRGQCLALGVQEGHPPWSVSGPGIQEEGMGGPSSVVSVRPGGTRGPGHEGILRGQCPAPGYRRPGYRRAILCGPVSGSGDKRAGWEGILRVSAPGIQEAILRGPVSGSGGTRGPGYRRAILRGQCPPRGQEGQGTGGHLRGPVFGSGGTRGLGTEAILRGQCPPSGVQEGQGKGGHPPWSVSAQGQARGLGARGPSSVVKVRLPGIQGGPSPWFSVCRGTRGQRVQEAIPPCPVSGPGVQRARVQEGHPPWSVSGPRDTGGPSSVVSVRLRGVQGPGTGRPSSVVQCPAPRGTGGPGVRGHPPWSVSGPRGTRGQGYREGHPPWSVSGPGIQENPRGQCPAPGVQEGQGGRAILRGQCPAPGIQEAILRGQCRPQGYKSRVGRAILRQSAPRIRRPSQDRVAQGYRAILRGQCPLRDYRRARVQDQYRPRDTEGHPQWSVSAQGTRGQGTGGHPPWSGVGGDTGGQGTGGHPPISPVRLRGTRGCAGYRRPSSWSDVPRPQGTGGPGTGGHPRGQCPAGVQEGQGTGGAILRGDVRPRGYRKEPSSVVSVGGPRNFKRAPRRGTRRAILRGRYFGSGVREGRGTGGPSSVVDVGPGIQEEPSSVVSVRLRNFTKSQGTGGPSSVVSVRPQGYRARVQRPSSISVNVRRKGTRARVQEAILRGSWGQGYGGHPPWSVSGPGIQEAILRGQCRRGYRRAHPPWSVSGSGNTGGPGYPEAHTPWSVSAPGIQEAILRGQCPAPEAGARVQEGHPPWSSVSPRGYRRRLRDGPVSRPGGYKRAGVQAILRGQCRQGWEDPLVVSRSGVQEGTGRSPSSVIQCPGPEDTGGLLRGQCPGPGTGRARGAGASSMVSVSPGIQEGHPHVVSVRPPGVQEVGTRRAISVVNVGQRYKRARMRRPILHQSSVGPGDTGGPSSVVSVRPEVQEGQGTGEAILRGQCPARGYKRARVQEAILRAESLGSFSEKTRPLSTFFLTEREPLPFPSPRLLSLCRRPASLTYAYLMGDLTSSGRWPPPAHITSCVSHAIPTPPRKEKLRKLNLDIAKLEGM
ncbi:collagen alpha-4(IV) chain-like, partial [Homarus americanus]|uniref:collagen alpha-4(IV) chain-like n=1 Tax=Homarus americanus TaxID=6706 RepID=UPI001C474EFD